MNNDILKEQIGLVIVNIIKRAIRDFQGKNLCNGICSKEVKKKFKVEAENWLIGDNCKFYCEMIGIDYIKILNRLDIRGKMIC